MTHARLLSLSLAAASVAAAGCKREGEGTSALPPAPELVAKGQQAVGAMKQQLVAALTEALKQGTPSAISVCSGVAPGIAQSISGGGVTVGRATRKPRNPANAAAGWREAAIARFEAVIAAGEPLAGTTWVTRLPDGTVAYAEPLVIQELCLACHGASLAPDVQAALAARYPADRATGYAVGELRGVAWAEVAPPPAPR